MKAIDTFLNGMTMHRLVLYLLAGLAGVTVIFAATGTLQYNPLTLLLSAAIFLAICFGANWLLAKLYGAVTTTESAFITALILFCIFSPPSTVGQAAILALVGVIAMASKYIIAWRARHVFNPAAVAALLIGFTGLVHASWWIASDVMALFVFVAGFLVMRKTRRTQMGGVFLVVGFVATVLVSAGDGRDLQQVITQTVLSWPLLFLGGFMLTEPLTTPPTHKLQMAYGALVGVLLGSQLHVGSVYMTPELALILGNGMAYATVLRRRLALKLVTKTPLGADIYDFAFERPKDFAFSAGQYLQTILPVPQGDIRGNRRTFTIAASPTEPQIHFGIKIPHDHPSRFKQVLANLQPGDHLYANQRAGSFLLPVNPTQKLVFIAGGIGITPFRSMVQQLIDTGQKRDIVLFYVVASPDQLVYMNILEKAMALGLTIVPVLSDNKDKPIADWSGETGFIDVAMLQRHLADVSGCKFYLSGPPGMVTAYQTLLRRQKVRRSQIIVDYFAGY